MLALFTLVLLNDDSVIALTASLTLRCAITESRALSLLRSAITESLTLHAAIANLFTLCLLTVAKQSFAVSELRACWLLLLNDSVIALTKALALRCAITEPLALSSTVTEPFALLLLTVAEQSFAVSKLRACLRLPNDAVVVLLSLPGTASELFLSV